MEFDIGTISEIHHSDIMEAFPQILFYSHQQSNVLSHLYYFDSFEFNYKNPHLLSYKLKCVQVFVEDSVCTWIPCFLSSCIFALVLSAVSHAN